MKKLLLVLPLLLSACAPVVTRINLPGTDNSTSVQITDLRPATEKESKIFSLLITSSEYGIYRKGDQTLDPPMTQIFRRMAYDKLGAGRAEPVSISIYHMVVYENRKSELRRGVAGGEIGGIIGAAVAAHINAEKTINISQSVIDRDQFEESIDEEYKRALYTDVENPQRASVFVIYIDAAVDGKRAFVKTMAPTQAPEGQSAYGLAVQSAIQYYLSQYAAGT